MPTQGQVELFYEKLPDAFLEIFVQKGQRISDAFQDGKSFRYGLVHLGGRDRQELREKFDACRKMLTFRFEPA